MGMRHIPAPRGPFLPLEQLASGAVVCQDVHGIKTVCEVRPVRVRFFTGEPVMAERYSRAVLETAEKRYVEKTYSPTFYYRQSDT